MWRLGRLAGSGGYSSDTRNSTFGDGENRLCHPERRYRSRMRVLLLFPKLIAPERAPPPFLGRGQRTRCGVEAGTRWCTFDIGTYLPRVSNPRHHALSPAFYQGGGSFSDALSFGHKQQDNTRTAFVMPSTRGGDDSRRPSVWNCAYCWSLPGPASRPSLQNSF